MTDFKKMDKKEFHALVASKGKEAVKWLIEQYKIVEPTNVYPRVKGDDGKWRADKSQEPKIEMRPKAFIAIKSDFAAKFAPELAPKAKEKSSDRADDIAALEALLATL